MTKIVSSIVVTMVLPKDSVEVKLSHLKIELKKLDGSKERLALRYIKIRRSWIILSIFFLRLVRIRHKTNSKMAKLRIAKEIVINSLLHKIRRPLVLLVLNPINAP